MNHRINGQPDAPEQQARARESVRQDMQRTSTAVGVVLFIVLMLALVIGITGARAARNLQRAEQAEAAGLDRLWNSYVAQARATRLTATAGRRENAVQVVSNAAALRTSPALRTEAVASLALTDLVREDGFATLPREGDQAEMDTALEHYAYGDARGTVFVRKLKDGTEVATLEARDLGPGMQQAVRSAAFSPDGKLLSIRFAGGALVVWNWATGERVLVAGAQATNLVIAGMSYAADSKQFMFSDPDRERQISVFDLEARKILATGIKAGARTFRFRPGSAQVGLATDNKVDLYEHPSEKILRTFEQLTRVFTLAWSPEGAQLAVSCEDGDVYLWDVERGTHRLLRGHSEPCIRIGFSPDGSLLFTGSRDGTTRLWDTALGQLIVSAEDGVGHVFSPDGTRLGFWRLSTLLGTWRVDRSDCYTALVCPKAEGALLSLDLSGAGRWCVATQTKGVRVWDLESGSRESFFPQTGLNSARVSPDGSALLVCTAYGLERWPVLNATNTNAPLAFGAAEEIQLPDNTGARNIALSAEGRIAAVELTDLRLVVLDLTRNQPPVIFPERWRTANLKGAGSLTGAGRFAISPDGRWVATGYWFGPKDTPRVWDAHTGAVVATLRADTSLVVFSADGQWLGLAGVREFQIYSTRDWQCVAKIPRDEASYTHGALAFLGDGGHIAFTRTRQQVQLREAFGETKFLDLIAPVPQSVNSLRLSLDGGVLATASARDVVQVWRLKNIRRHLATLKLDWGGKSEEPPLRVNAYSSRGLSATTMLLLGLAGFAVVALLSLLTLRRHRVAIERFFAAEANAARRNRELEVAKVELMHSQKMQALGTLATGIAHDFNNLLSVIRMSGKLIGREAKSQSEIQEHVADIEQAVLQGKSVVGSMLGYARAEDGAGEPTDVSAVVEDTVSLLSREFLSGLTLILELNRNAPKVGVSRGRLEQVLLNLIVNASEAMQGQGKLKLTVQVRAQLPARSFALRPAAAPRFVELSVVDSGPGIPPEIQARLFEPFFTTKRSGAKAGTGLGLSLIYNIAEQDGLGVSVASEPGNGATFTLTIPVAETTPVRETHSFQTNASP